MRGVASSGFGTHLLNRLQNGRRAVAACGMAVAALGSAAHGAIVTVNGGDPEDGLVLSNVVQATSQTTYSQERENGLTGGTNVTWQGVSFGFANSSGFLNGTGSGFQTAHTSAPEGPAAGLNMSTFNIGTSANDLAVTQLLKVVQYNTASTIEFFELTPGTQYRIDLLVFMATSNPRATTVSYNGGPVAEYQLEPISNSFYDIYETATADASGKITMNLGTGTYTGPAEFHDDTGAVWNALIVSAVPEPASASLLGGAALALMCRRQRRIEA